MKGDCVPLSACFRKFSFTFVTVGKGVQDVRACLVFVKYGGNHSLLYSLLKLPDILYRRFLSLISNVISNLFSPGPFKPFNGTAAMMNKSIQSENMLLAITDFANHRLTNHPEIA